MEAGVTSEGLLGKSMEQTPTPAIICTKQIGLVKERQPSDHTYIRRAGLFAGFVRREVVLFELVGEEGREGWGEGRKRGELGIGSGNMSGNAKTKIKTPLANSIQSQSGREREREKERGREREKERGREHEREREMHIACVHKTYGAAAEIIMF